MPGLLGVDLRLSVLSTFLIISTLLDLAWVTWLREASAWCGHELPRLGVLILCPETGEKPWKTHQVTYVIRQNYGKNTQQVTYVVHFGLQHIGLLFVLLARS